jgi:hypothetical protein
MKSLFFLIAISCLVLAGCYYDKSDEVNPGAGLFVPCDTTHPVSYERHILPILQNYCYSCHSGSQPSSTYHLDDYNSVHTQAANGNLWGDLSGARGFPHMPPSFTLDSCYLKQFDYWINVESSPNN